MRIQYFTFNDIDSIMFAGEWNPVNKIKKNINIKGYVRKGKFVRSSNREQNVRETAVKIAAVSLGVLATVLGVSLASAALTKVRYNKNLVDFGKKMANNLDDIEDMKIPGSLKKISKPKVTDKKSMTFFIGGMGKFEDAQGEKLMKSVRSAYAKQGRPIDKNHELIPLFHNHQVRNKVKIAGKEMELGVVQEIGSVFEKAAISGYNKDSVIMAKEIYKWHKLNPDKPINIITGSAGGFQGRDIPHILQAAGVDTKKLMKVFSTATPDFGLVDEIVPTLKVMHSDDMYAHTIPKTLISMPSLHRGTVFLGKGDTPMYRRMVMKKAMFDAKNEVVVKNGKFVAGKQFQEPSDKDLKKVMPAIVHFGPAYWNGETPTSKKTLQYLNNFMFKN